MVPDAQLLSFTRTVSRTSVKPATVKIVMVENQVFAGRPFAVRCETWGSSPAARIIWRLGEQVSGEPNVSTTQRSNMTVSRLTLMLNKEDDEKELICRAENPRFPGGAIEEVKTLRVFCECLQPRLCRNN